MKTPTSETIIALFFILFLQKFCGAILHGSGNIYEDITSQRQYGCVYSGGSSPGLTCNCQENAEDFNITPGLIDSLNTMSVQINNCKTVKMLDKSIEDMRNIRTIQFNNIGTLQFETGSMKWYGYNSEEESYGNTPSLTITILNSNITSIPSQTFSGRINQITLDKITINDLQPYAFSKLLQTDKISIKNTVLNNVHGQAFKKFATEDLYLQNVKADLLPSRTFSDVQVSNNFIIDNCNFTTLRPGAFIINQPKNFQVSNTNITQLDGEAFKVLTRGPVLMKKNNFKVVNDGAFTQIRLNRDEIKSDTTLITFDSNTFSTLSRDSLNVQDFKAKFVKLQIDEICDCKSIDHNLKETNFYSEIRCKYNDEFVTVDEFKSHMCSVLGSYLTTIVVVSVVLAVFVIVCIILLVYYKRVHKSRKYGSKTGKKGNLSLIVPDGRTYRETELHVIVEKTDLLTTDL